jgi:hypothetical protein
MHLPGTRTMIRHTYSKVLPLSLLLCALICTGCIHPDQNHAGSGSHPIELAESQSAALKHLGIMIESQNRAINAFNNRDYATCQVECKQTAAQNKVYASLVGAHAELVRNASLSGSDKAYYETQLDILQAFQRNINQSTFDLNLACEYAADGDDTQSQYHVEQASESMVMFHDNIDHFNDNVDARDKGSGDFTSPASDPIDSPDTTHSGKTDLSDIPDPYYLNKTRFQNTADEVKRLLGKGFFTSYACSSFDCSEMAAYIEWKLECHNVTAQIATKDDWAGGYGHAWVIVSLRGGKHLAIEPTISAMEGSLGAEMITYDPEYFVYDHLFEDIYEASEFFGVEEWDWWNKLKLG